VSLESTRWRPSLRVVFDERAAYVLDGDLMRAREVRVEPGPTLRLIVP